MREALLLGVIEVVRGTVGGEMMVVEKRNIETEVGTEKGIRDETITVMKIVTTLAFREKAVTGMERGVGTIGMMRDGEKSDIELEMCFMRPPKGLFPAPNADQGTGYRQY